MIHFFKSNRSLLEDSPKPPGRHIQKTKGKYKKHILNGLYFNLDKNLRGNDFYL